MAIHWLVALAPIAVALLLLAVRVPGLWAGLAALGVALLGGLTLFTPTAETVTTTATQMAPTVLVVALIILGGVGLAEAMGRTGAQDAISAWLERTERGGDRMVTLLLLVYGMTPFMEAVTGFGIGVVITVPLLIRYGLTPMKAVTAGLLGLVTAPWGSLAPGMLVSAQLGDEDFAELGVWSAWLSLPVLAVSMVVLLALAGRPVRTRLVLLGIGVVLVQWACLIGASLLLGPPLTGVLTAVAVIVALLLVSRVRHGRLPPVTAHLVRALTPYLVLIAGILAATAGLALTGHPPGWGWVANPALWIMIAALSTPWPLRIPRTQLPAMARQALARWVTAGGTAVVFLLLGIVMSATGMAEHLADQAAGMGTGFIAAIPAIGALGGYLTGSNTGAAAMFSTATTTASGTLGASPMVTLAAQNVTASFGMIASPSRIALAMAVAGPGQRFTGVRVLLAAVGAVVLILAVVVPLIA